MSLDELRKPWETHEMWKLRKAFLERYLGDESMTKNRVICLSQMLVNMEFLGCSYDADLMAKIKSMSDGFTKEIRQARLAMLGEDYSKDEDMEKAPKKRRKVEGNASPVKKSASKSNTIVSVTTTTPVCAIKLKILQSLKAELMVMQQQRMPDDPLAVLNQACLRAKCNWRIHFNEEKHYCSRDVVVVEQVYWGVQIRSRIEACRRAAYVLQRPFFDVREKAPEKGVFQGQETEMELYTRTDAQGDWESPSTSRFQPLEQAFMAMRKRLAAIGQETRKKGPETYLRDAAKSADLTIDMKRQHLGGWKEEIIVTVGKVELCRHQGRIPPKGKEQESANECYLKCIDAVLKPTLSDGICVADEKGTLTIGPKPKLQEKPSTLKTTSRQSSHDRGNEAAKKELAIKSVRLHLNATSETMNPVQRIEQSCVKAKVKYEVQFDGAAPFTATVFMDDVRIGVASDTNKKGAKSKACVETIQQLLLPYLRIKQDSDCLSLEASKKPFGD